MNEPTDEEKRKKKVSFGPAQLLPVEEAGHFGLFRPLIIDAWDDQKGEFVRIEGDQPVGPLAVFREARRGEKVHMRTFHPTEKRTMDLTCVWDPQFQFTRGEQPPP